MQMTETVTAASAPRNVWYVAAWSSEVHVKPFGRRILGRPVVLFRGTDGSVAAMEDRCSHRGLPLSLGRVVGNQLQCGYHGLCFEKTGRCSKVPGQDAVPATAIVEIFPVVEQDALIWIWMGDKALADATSIQRFLRHGDPSWTWRGEHFAYKADHLLLYDNLLDLTHVGYVHPTTIGGNEQDHSAAEMTVERMADGVKGVRWMRDVTPPAAYTALWPFKGNIDRCQVMHFHPGMVTICIVAKDVGTLAAEDDFENAYQSHGFHGVTPETDSSCHYFWSVGLPTNLSANGMIEQKQELTQITFEEDREILEAQYKSHQEFADRSFVAIRSDALGMAARRIWTALSAKEEKSAAQSLGTPVSGLSESGSQVHIRTQAN